MTHALTNDCIGGGCEECDRCCWRYDEDGDPICGMPEDHPVHDLHPFTPEDEP